MYWQNIVFSSIYSVETATEGSEDSKFMAQIAYLGKKKVHELRTETTHFRPQEFADKLVYFTVEF